MEPLRDENASPQCAAATLISRFSIATGMVFVIFGALNFSHGLYLLGGFEFLLGVGQFVNYRRIQRGVNRCSVARFLMLSVYFMSLVIFITGGIATTGYMWILFMPLFTMLMLEKPESTRWLAGYLLLIVALTVAHLLGIIALKYQFDTLRQTLVVFALFVYLTYENEKIRKQTHDQLVEQNQRLEELSHTDYLTQLYNRTFLSGELRREYSRSKRYGTFFSVIMIDVDHFKQINDTHGHQAGDEVLQRIAELLKNNVRKNDVVGRWGGEEFLILCPEIDTEGAAAMAEKLRKTIETEFSDVDVRVTASFGVKAISEGQTLDALLSEVDVLLYRAKDAGRNCVVQSAA